MEGTPATNPNVKRTFCGIRRRQQKAYESMQRIMANVNGSQQGREERGGSSVAKGKPKRDKINYSTWKCNYENI